MHLRYKFIETGLSSELEKIIISPGNANMAILKAMVNRPDMQLNNPAREFATRMKIGGFEGWTEEDIAAEAEIANIICEAWNGKPEENIFSIMAELARMYVAEKKRIELPDVFGSNKE